MDTLNYDKQVILEEWNKLLKSGYKFERYPKTNSGYLYEIHKDRDHKFLKLPFNSNIELSVNNKGDLYFYARD